jgi:hypothetical protein
MSTIIQLQKPRLLLGGLLILIGLLLPLSVIEGLLRVFGPDWLDLRMQEIDLNETVYFDSDAGWPLECSELNCYMFASNSKFQVVTQEYSHAVNIELGGYRSNGALTYDDRVTIPILGDSFTFGLGVEDNETFVSLLDRMSTIRYLNLGIPGNSITQHIDIVERRHHELGDPSNYVFVFFVGNDFQNILESHIISSKKSGVDVDDGSKVDYYPTTSNKFNILSTINEYVMHNTFLSKLYVVQWVRHKLLMFVNRSSADLMDPIFLIIRKDKDYLADAKLVFENELKRLDRLSKKLHFDYVFLIIPDRHQIDSNLLHLRSEYYGIAHDKIDTLIPNNLLAALFQSHGVPYIDVTNCMANADDIESLFYVRDNHFTTQGHRVAATCMAKELERTVK